MAVVKHGVSTNTPARVMIDAGAVYVGFLSATNPGTLLGATRGGNVFELTRNFRDMPVDGARGKVKGMRRLESVDAKITARMLELTAETLRLAIAAGRYSSGMTTVTSESQENGNAVQTVWQLGFQIEDCEDAWNEQVIGGVTASLDAADFQTGAGSAKFVVADGAASGLLGTEAVSLAGNTLDDFTRLGLWIKSSIAISEGQLQIVLDDTALCASPCATINLPALAASTWTRVNVPADFSGCTGLTIISVGIKQTVDLGAFNLWIDQVKAVRHNIETNSDTVVVNGVTLVRGTDYAVDTDKAEIQFAVAPGNTQTVVVTYKTRTAAVNAVIAGGEVDSTYYVDNVAIVGTVQGYTNPIIVKIDRVLADAGLNLSFADKDELVTEIVFSAHYLVSALTTEPWSIEYPAS